MNGYNFTDRVRKVLQMAREESARLHHEYVRTEHILLGLIREGEGVAEAVLTNLNVDLVKVRQTIEKNIALGKTEALAGPDLPYTSHAIKVLEYSMSEARELHHSYVGTEHLLLGLLREKVGIAAQVLTDAGVRLELVRAETLRLLGTQESGSVRNQPSYREGKVGAYSFTSEFRRSVQVAREEAIRLRSDHVDAVHIALAILGMKDGAAVAVLTALGVDSIALRDNLEAKLGREAAEEVGSWDLPYTRQAKNVLELAMAEASELRHPEVSSEHLLLAILREGVFDLPNAPLSHVRMKVAELRR